MGRGPHPTHGTLRWGHRQKNATLSSSCARPTARAGVARARAARATHRDQRGGSKEHGQSPATKVGRDAGARHGLQVHHAVYYLDPTGVEMTW